MVLREEEGSVAITDRKKYRWVHPGRTGLHSIMKLSEHFPYILKYSEKRRKRETGSWKNLIL